MIKAHLEIVLYGNILKEIRPIEDLWTCGTHKRLSVFIQKGRWCVTCGREGTLFLLTVNPKDGSRHLDLYTEDLILMTVDHIVPKKQARQMGWKRHDIESLDNKQPMCQVCNTEKADRLVTNEEFQKIRSVELPRTRLSAVNLMRGLIDKGAFQYAQ